MSQGLAWQWIFWISHAGVAELGAELVPPPMVGKASGTFNTLGQLGGATGVAVLAAVFAGNGGLGSAASFSDGLGPAIGVAVMLSLGGAVAGLFVVARKSSSSEGDRDEQRVHRQLQDQT